MFKVAVRTSESIYFTDRTDTLMDVAIVFVPSDQDVDIMLIASMQLLEVQHVEATEDDWKFVITVESDLQWFLLQMVFNPKFLNKLKNDGCVISLDHSFDLDYDGFKSVKSFKSDADEKFMEEDNVAYESFMRDIDARCAGSDEIGGPFTVITADSDHHSHLIGNLDEFMDAMLLEENFETAGQFIEESLKV